MTDSRITAEFIASTRGRIFVLARCPAKFDGRCVLIVPPFAEEMNKSRKAVTELAQRLNKNGVGAVIPDFFGTGDSAGEFAETDCDVWQQDLAAVDRWAAEKGWSFDSVVAIRLGCASAAKYAQQRSTPFRSAVFWQPTLDGARAFEQFLRLRVAASLMEDKKETVAELRAQLAAGQSVEVAGYDVSPSLAKQLEQLKSQPATMAALGRLHWFEVLRSAEAPVAVPAVKAVESLRAAGVDVDLRTVVGEPFWASTEIVVPSALVEATAECILRALS